MNAEKKTEQSTKFYRLMNNMILRKSLLEEDLMRLEHRAKHVIKEARASANPEEYIKILDGIQFEVNFILGELKKYE